jgi:hypothetical protein
MTRLPRRFSDHDVSPTQDTQRKEILNRLEGGESPARVQTELGLEPLDVVAALAMAGLGVGEDAQGPPLVQAAPPRPKLARSVREEALAGLLPKAAHVALLTLQAGLCQVLDFWDPSHHAAQEADDLGERSFSAYWHGIAHRREPDASNASYWFRRVGRHPLFPELARGASPLLSGPVGSALADRLIKGGTWDPHAFIEICTRARPGSDEAILARKLQRLEMALLLDATVEPLS